MKKILIVVTACLGLPLVANASCSTSTTAPGSGYTNVCSSDATSEPAGHKCSATETIYLVDTTQQVYCKQTQCKTCTAANSVMVATEISVGSCSFTYNSCHGCYTTNTVPSGASQSGAPSKPLCEHSTKYLVYEPHSSRTLYIPVYSCTDCGRSETKTISLGPDECNTTYSACTVCSNGKYFYQGSCLSCPAGTYSLYSSSDITSCTTCPDADNIYNDNDLTTKASVSSGVITSASGSNSPDDCQIIAGTYFDSKGHRFKYKNGTCYSNGVFKEIIDYCAEITPICSQTSGTSGTVTTNIPGSSSSGPYCWCKTNGKALYLANMNVNSTCLANCASTCQSAITNNSAFRVSLGCD